FEFRADRMTSMEVGRTPTFVDTFHLDESREPKEIDLAQADRPEKLVRGRGIYSLNGSVLQLCFTFDDKSPRPKEFRADAGSKRILHILRRVPATATAQPEVSPTLQPDAGMIERIDDIQRKMSQMQTEIDRLREELKKSKKPQIIKN